MEGSSNERSTSTNTGGKKHLFNQPGNRISMEIREHIEETLSHFSAISLEELGKASLMRRKDNKYIFGYADLASILAAVRYDYSVLDIGGIRSHGYHTVYYDTEKRDMYMMHHRGRVNRYKIRFRRYGTSDVMFLEVKKKDSKGVTTKNRIRTGSNQAEILTGEEAFLASNAPYPPGSVFPVLENSFSRITLVAPDLTERITLDYGLRFSQPGGGRGIELPGLSIAEIKFSERLTNSPFHHTLRDHRIIPTRFSKYCIGTALLNPQVKQNRFKEKIRRVQKINNAFF